MLRRSSVFWYVIGGAGPVLVGLALLPFETSAGRASVALILVLTVALVASSGRRGPTIGTAFSAALVCDVLYTEPRGRFTIDEVEDLVLVAELLAAGEEEEIVVITAAFWLRELLALQDCRLDRGLDPASPTQIRAEGVVRVGSLRWSTETIGLPGPEADLPLNSNGRAIGRFVLTPTPGVPVLPDRLLTAAALADLVGSWLGAHGQRPPLRS